MHSVLRKILCSSWDIWPFSAAENREEFFRFLRPLFSSFSADSVTADRYLPLQTPHRINCPEIILHWLMQYVWTNSRVPLQSHALINWSLLLVSQQIRHVLKTKTGIERLPTSSASFMVLSDFRRQYLSTSRIRLPIISFGFTFGISLSIMACISIRSRCNHAWANQLPSLFLAGRRIKYSLTEEQMAYSGILTDRWYHEMYHESIPGDLTDVIIHEAVVRAVSTHNR